MLNFARFFAVIAMVMLLQGCTAAANFFDNNCSGTGIDPGEDYCADYTDGP